MPIRPWLSSINKKMSQPDLRGEASMLLVTRRSDWCIKFKVLGQRVTFEVRSNVQNVKIPLPTITWLLMALDKKLTSSVFLLSRRTPFDSFLFNTFGRLLFPKIKIVFSGHIWSLTSRWFGGTMISFQHILGQYKTYGVASTPMCRRMFKLRIQLRDFSKRFSAVLFIPFKKSS